MNLGAGPQTPGIYRFCTNPEVGIMKRGAVLTPHLSLGPRVGARVASQHGPIFRPSRVQL